MEINVQLVLLIVENIIQMEHVMNVKLIILWFYQDVDTIIFLVVNMKLLNIPVPNVIHHSNYQMDIVILITVKSSMIMDVLHVNVDFILLPIEIVNQFNQDVLDIKMVFVKIVLLIINLKEVFVKFKDAQNMKEVIVQNVQVNMIKLMDNVNLKIVSIGSMINVLPVKRDMFWKTVSVNNLTLLHVDELIKLISY